MKTAQNKPWYAGEHQDALFYLLIAIFFIELIVGGIAFFYGIIHARPEMAGGPPVARFPWLAWALAATLSPVVLLLIVHLAGSWLSATLTHDERPNLDLNSSSPGSHVDENLPEGMKRFYASVRHAPTIVLLVGILLLGATLFFMEGAFGAIVRFGSALIPYIPWIAGSAGALLAFCFLAHAVMVYRQRKMENEYAWRREVLEKTGLVLVDKASVPLPLNERQKSLVAPEQIALESTTTLDVTPTSLPPANEDDKDPHD